jgi:hypothetical protein
MFLQYGADFTKTGEKDVAASITPEALAADTGEDIKAVALIAKATNTGDTFFGDSTGQLFPIPKFGEGAPFAFAAKNLADIYIKVGGNGDGVYYSYAIREH